MGAHHAFPTEARTRRVLTWHDLLKIAREHEAFAEQAVTNIRDEARAGKGCCDSRLCKLIADAAQGWLDCPCSDCLDEIDALMADDEPDEIDRAWDRAERGIRTARHESVNDYGRWWL